MSELLHGLNQASNAKCHEALLRLQEEREPVATVIESEDEYTDCKSKVQPRLQNVRNEHYVKLKD